MSLVTMLMLVLMPDRTGFSLDSFFFLLGSCLFSYLLISIRTMYFIYSIRLHMSVVIYYMP
jgi:hypothetical protein